jgi:SET domain-containing protein
MKSDNNAGFCVPYTVRFTSDKGRGVFADAPILKGTILWRHVRGQYAVYDERLLKELLAKLTRKEVVYELTHMFGLPEFPGYVIRVFDDGVLINHSRQPTVVMNNASGDNEIPYNTSPQDVQDVEDELLNDRFALIATQDLKAGDELTQDYNICIEDPAYYDALCEQYDVSWPWL